MNTSSSTFLFLTTTLALLNISISLPLTPFKPPSFPTNNRLQDAYTALQAWKRAITSDPNNFTTNWCGFNVCAYNGVYCAPAPDDPAITTVAGVDLNNANIAGTLRQEVGLLTDLALLHLNSNRFTGTVPDSFVQLKRLYEVDLSGNEFSGGFPTVLLSIESLKFLDIRFNNFQGSIPSSLFDKKLDAIFINNNKFTSNFPQNIGKSTASVIVFANISLSGCIPPTISNMASTLDEIILTNINLQGCLPSQIGDLTNLKVLDISFNQIVGKLPETIGQMKNLELLDVSHNQFRREVPVSVCRTLPNLNNFTFSYNYFCSEPAPCLRMKGADDRLNCIPYRPNQRPVEECQAVLSQHVNCDHNIFGCLAST